MITDREAAEILDRRTGQGYVARYDADPGRWAPAIRAMLAHLDGQPTTLPSMPRMAGNFARATVRDLAHGGARLDDAGTEARLAICRACPDGLYLIDGRGRERCRHPKCGCVLTRKARRPHERCPLGHWPEVTSEPSSQTT